MSESHLTPPKERNYKAELYELIAFMPEHEQNEVLSSVISHLRSNRQEEVERLQKRIVELKTLISQLP